VLLPTAECIAAAAATAVGLFVQAIKAILIV